MDGSAFTFLARGAIIQHFEVAGVDIVQGFPSEDLYTRHNAPFFGETIGRVANRVAGATLRVPGPHGLNGRPAYALAANDGANALHGGPRGWGKQTWAGPTPVGVRRAVPGLAAGPLTSGGESVQFVLVSADGDEGYPGTVRATVTYTVGKQEEGGKTVTVLVMEYEAELVGDDDVDETVINMTNHTYFNLAGAGAAPSINGTVVALGSTTYLPVDAGGIPTDAGPSGPFPGIPPTPNTPFVLGPDEPDIDDCFIVGGKADAAAIDTRAQPLTRLVAAHHPATGIHLEVLSTEPAFQFYTGKYIDVPAVSDDAGGAVPARGRRSGFCVEPSRFVNAGNVAAWKDQVLLRRGATYGARTVYRAWKE